MRLIGMLDSPYVRRVAISLKRMGIPFEHEAVSVFRHMDRFRAINPVVKAPTLVADDGTVLMDSTLILDYAETLVPAAKRLMPPAGPKRLAALHTLGVALAACEKCVQIVYEKERRAVVDAAWMSRISRQALDAFDWLGRELDPAQPMDAAGITVACVWRFSQYYDAAEIAASRYPKLVDYSRRAEALPEFASTPLD